MHNLLFNAPKLGLLVILWGNHDLFTRLLLVLVPYDPEFAQHEEIPQCVKRTTEPFSTSLLLFPLGCHLSCHQQGTIGLFRHEVLNVPNCIAAECYYPPLPLLLVFGTIMPVANMVWGALIGWAHQVGCCGESTSECTTHVLKFKVNFRLLNGSRSPGNHVWRFFKEICADDSFSPISLALVLIQVRG